VNPGVIIAWTQVIPNDDEPRIKGGAAVAATEGIEENHFKESHRGLARVLKVTIIR
jgi:hypothetical protein